MDKKITNKPENPNVKTVTHRPEELPSTDSRDWHGLSESEVIKGKK
ncbi:MAG: hypothetical protein M0T74_07960 [Desulfitobacterium hafniense]|nr:hypothetical protein [Desulfitobacterium hafniense]